MQKRMGNIALEARCNPQKRSPFSTDPFSEQQSLATCMSTSPLYSLSSDPNRIQGHDSRPSVHEQFCVLAYHFFCRVLDAGQIGEIHILVQDKLPPDALANHQRLPVDMWHYTMSVNASIVPLYASSHATAGRALSPLLGTV